ncbi:MAG: hypothetical protein K2X39_00390, partial [Silvanigrellaceae bacterium]|nr:hypothetical protein [Silvanigrellaceae bacterium]
MLNEVLNLYREYAVIPFIILAVIIVGYTIIIEKLILLQLVYRINFVKFNDQIKKMLSANDLDRAKNLCLATSKTGIPRIAAKAIDTYETDPMKVRTLLSEETLRFFPRIRRRISQLPNLAAGCVLLGAVAAIDGAWFSFQMVEGLELGIKSFAFSKGLGDALIP